MRSRGRLDGKEVEQSGATVDILEAGNRSAAIAKDLVDHYVDGILPDGFRVQVACHPKLEAGLARPNGPSPRSRIDDLNEGSRRASGRAPVYFRAFLFVLPRAREEMARHLPDGRGRAEDPAESRAGEASRAAPVSGADREYRARWFQAPRDDDRRSDGVRERRAWIALKAG